ncbi:LLM class flavin-dependent oxidoreductase [Gordonia sp. HNM0687]|uniref:LLM class flavin-dependent oxidoreductase n=1 Tax=Gordonia mangrovi TaxID=2665643 RepID=A0A6L7GU33_9ACTN|nr:LLM class flavin-dependent oxidoreductase [Gordonia mangrovi]MXP23456.1 LLM class flavin-dependent oxidoreductase [Gordonia mangrovi]UVF76648.1 LLM class flavin-dependent oxidoreductase [Gordonia mangrovi]
MSETTVGVVFRPEFTPELLPGAARTADEVGLDELWIFEDCFLNGGISAAAVALANSRRLTVAIGVLPAPMRNVALTAMEIATLCRLYPGRVRIGVGHGVQDWMQQIGAKVASPMTLLREYLTALRALLDGERVTMHGKYVELNDVQLAWPPEQRVELICAATGPKTLRLSGELATATVLASWTTPQMIRDSVVSIDEGRAQRTDTSPHDVITYLQTTFGTNAKDRAIEELRSWGFDVEADLAAYGSPEDVAAAARRWIDAGAGTIVLQPSPDVDINEFVTIAARQVQPLLKALPE